MDGFEYIVRPYQSPNAQGRAIIPSTPTGSRERATLIWGAKAKAVIPDTPSISVVCCDEQLQEKQRQSEPVRVYKNGDPASDQWIDYERPIKMALKKSDKASCDDNSWNQMSFVATSISEDLASWDSFFAGYDSTDEHCKASWTFTYGKQ
jgi:hypothetical protein